MSFALHFCKQDAKPKTRKEIMEEVVAKAKLKKVIQ
jgi:hypothetical protein